MRREDQMNGHAKRYAWPDGLLAALIFAGTVAYLVALPRNLNPADESIYLYEAKRLLHGEVMYVDVFDLITPGWMYLMALLFRLFGTDMATARLATAVLHGVAAVGIYCTGRALHVRRGLAWPAPVAYLVVSQAAWPIASQHWLSTLLCVIVLWVCVARSRARPTWTFLPGVVIGLLIAVQQQRGLIIAAGVFVWLILDHALQHRFQPGPPSRRLIVQLTCLMAGASSIIVPMLVFLVARAGVSPVWEALVVFPVANYGGITHCEWGNINILTVWQGSFTFPRALKYLPVVLGLIVPRLAVLWIRRRELEEARTLLLLAVFCLASMLSIAYFPDFIHIAFIAPAFLVAIAWCAESLVRWLPAPRRARQVVGWLAAALVVVAAGARLQRNLSRLREAYPVSRDTAFGHVDLAATDAAFYDRIKELMRDASSPYLFASPNLYLLVDAPSPIPYGFFLAQLYSREQVQRAIDLLAERRPSYVVLPPFTEAHDPIVEWVSQRYEPIPGTDAISTHILRPKRVASTAG
jgi:hypothetical protein